MNSNASFFGEYFSSFALCSRTIISSSAQPYPREGTDRVDFDGIKLETRVTTLELCDNVEHERVLRLRRVEQADRQQRDDIRARGEVERDPLAVVSEARPDSDRRCRVCGADIDGNVLRRLGEGELEAGAGPRGMLV
jgi:hypothetical protein